MTDKYEILLVTEPDEVKLYLEAYPGLLDDCRVRFADEWRKCQGLRVTRCYVAESVVPDTCMALEIILGSMAAGIPGIADKAPIFLREAK